MIVKWHIKRLQTVEDIRSLLRGATTFDFEPQSREEAYKWVRDSLRQLLYSSLRKADRGAVKESLEKVTGLSRAQVARLIRQYKQTGGIRDRRGGPGSWTGMPATSAWRPSPTGTCTTCERRAATRAAGGTSRRPGRTGWGSASGESQGPTASPASCGSTRCTKGIWTA